MRLISMGILAAVACIGGPVMAAEDDPMPEAQVTVQDVDGQIQMVKDQVEKFNSLAKTFDRKASMLQSHDYMGSRNAAVMRDQCRAMADDLSKHLAELEQHRASMMEQGKK